MQATQSVTQTQTALKGLTLAVVRMPAMVDFYQSVFHAEFQPVEAYGAMLFRGKIAGLDLLLYPQEVAGIHVDQNRFLLKFEVTDINHILNLALTNGGSLLNAPVDNDGTKAAAVRDPDGNSIEFEQKRY
jgi:predicted enzyme related to lactoylglutathione lyase